MANDLLLRRCTTARIIDYDRSGRRRAVFDLGGCAPRRFCGIAKRSRRSAEAARQLPDNISRPVVLPAPEIRNCGGLAARPKDIREPCSTQCVNSEASAKRPPRAAHSEAPERLLVPELPERRRSALREKKGLRAARGRAEASCDEQRGRGRCELIDAHIWERAVLAVST